MGAEVATLGLSVDSRPIATATSAMQTFRQEAREVVKATDQMEQSGLSATDAIKGLAAAFGLFKLAQQIKELAQMQGQYEMYGVALHAVGKNAGYTSAEVDKYTTQLQKNGIAQMESRSAMTQAIQAHIQLADTVKLGRIAQDAAVIGNINSSEAYSRLIHGLQSGTVEVLRTIGINVNFEQSYKKMAAELKKNVDQLTENEKAQARVNAVMEKGKDIQGVYEASLGSAGKQLLSMKRYISDTELQIGQTFGPAYTAIIFSMAEAFKDVNKEVSDLKTSGQLDVWAQHIGSSVSTTIGWVKGATSFVWEHKAAVLALGEAYVGLKITSVISNLAVGTENWVKAKRNAITASTDSIKSEIAEATTKLALARAEVARQGAAYATVEASIAERAATDALTAAEVKLATAKTASSMASRAFGLAITALGGPIGAIVTVLGLLATAYAIWGDKLNATSKQEQEAIKRGREYADELERQVAAIKEKNRIENAKADPSSGVNDKASDATRKNLDEQMKLYGAVQVKIQNLKDQIASVANSPESLNEGNAAIYSSLSATLKAEEEKQKNILETYRRIQQGEIDKQGLEAQGAAKQEQEAIKRKKELKEAEEAEQKRLMAKQKTSTQQEVLNKLESEEIALMDKSTLAAKVKAERAQAELQAKRDIDDIEKRKKAGTVTASEATADEARVVAIKAKRLQKIEDDAKLEQEKVDRETREMSGIQAELSWQQKISKMKEAFNKANAKREKEGLDPLSTTDLNKGIEQFTNKERITEISRLQTELGKLAEEKGRALNFDEQIASLDALAHKIGVEVPGAVDELRKKLETMRNRKTDGIGGMVAGMEEWSDKATDLFSNMKEKVQGWADKSTDAIVNFSNKGKGAFKDLANSVILDLERMAVQQNVTGPLFKFLSSALTNYFTQGSGGGDYTTGQGDDPGMLGHAAGGFTAGRKPIMVGEKGPEVFNPGGPGTVIPNNMLGGGDSTSIVFQTTINADGTSSASQTSGKASEHAAAIEAAQRRFVQREMEPGGSIWRFVKG